jgi:tripartite ATP-independent transporter DctM subunit
VNPGKTRLLARVFYRIEEGICWFSMLLLALVPLADVVLKLVFKSGFPDAQGLLVHVLLILGLFSGLETTRSGDHLSIGLIQYLEGKAGGAENVKRFSAAAGCALSAFVVTIIAWASLSFIRLGLMGWLVCGIIPDRIFAAAIPLACAVMAFRFVRQAPAGVPKIIAALAPVVGTAVSLPVIAKALWGFDAPEIFLNLNDALYGAAGFLKIPAVMALILAALGGAPLFTVLGGMALLLITAAGGESDVAANQVYLALTQDNIIPIPLFTLAGFFLSESRAGERLLGFFRGLFGRLPGGLVIVTVIICAFFTSFTGASGVTILALGGLLYAILRGEGADAYPEAFTIGLLTSTGSIGLLFPPSLPIILVGSTTQTNILQLFAGGLIPGLILTGAVMIFGIAASPRKAGGSARCGAAGGIRKGLKESALELLLPVLLVAAFFGGLLSITELGAAALIYVFVVEVLIHRDISPKNCVKVFKKAVPIIGGILSIIALSMALSYYIVDSQVPQNLAAWMSETIDSKYLFLLLLNLLLLAVGCLMDIFSAILVVLPLVAPLGAAYGIDPVHLGVIFIINLEVGFLTPPVGLNLFLASYRFKKPFVEICHHVLPFLAIQFAVVLLVTYVPALSTALIKLF